MSEDRIERETLIAAPLERVWSLVAEPGFWVADKASLYGTVAIEGESMVAKNAEYGEFPVRVEKVAPPTYLAYRWASAFPGEEPREDNSSSMASTDLGNADAAMGEPTLIRQESANARATLLRCCAR